MKMIRSATLAVIGGSLVALAALAQPPGGGKPNKDDDNKKAELAAKLIDGDWKSDEGEYDFSDVDVIDDVATFYFTRKKKLGKPHEDMGGRRFEAGHTVTCQGTGSYDPDTRIFHAQEICPSHWRGRHVAATLTMKLEVDGGFGRPKVQLDGKRAERYLYVVRGDLKSSDVTERDETLKREKDRQGGPKRRRFGGGGPGPGPGGPGPSGPGSGPGPGPKRP